MKLTMKLSVVLASIFITGVALKVRYCKIIGNIHS